MIFYFISIIATPLLLISQSKLKYPFLLKYKNSLEQTEKYTKGFSQYYYICGCTGLRNQCKFELANLLAGISATATELEINRFWNAPSGELVWHLSTQVNNGLVAA